MEFAETEAGDQSILDRDLSRQGMSRERPVWPELRKQEQGRRGVRTFRGVWAAS